MHYVLLSNYNNYYNRIYKKQDTYQQYINASAGNVLGIDKSYNFNIKDGVMTEHVFNCKLDGEPDYCLILNEADNSIASRWFIVEWEKVRGSQYKATLRRDVLADEYDAITSAPAFIEKGYVGPEDSAIFNRENITVNQIKTSETVLKDDSKTAWIVGYIAQDHPALSDKQFTLDPEVDMVISANFSDWEYANWCDGTQKSSLDLLSNNRYEFCIEDYFTALSYGYVFSYGNNYHVASYVRGLANRWWCNIQNQATALKDTDWYSSISVATTVEKIEQDNPSWCPNDDYSKLLSLVGKKIQFNDGVYQLSITTNLEKQERIYADTNSNLYSYLYNNISNQLATKFGSNIGGTVNYPVFYDIYLNKFTIVATKLENIQGTYKYSLPQTVRKLDDAPYKMFCIPYYTGNYKYRFSVDGTSYRDVDKEIQMGWAMSIAKELGDSLYDLQILPYCPISNYEMANDRALYSVGKTVNVDYVELKRSDDVTCGYCSFCDVSSKEQFIKRPIEVLDYKLENQCDMYRLCSPNYASVFEFNAARNGGVEGYNVRYTYKPYQPFINVAPKFGRLYGKDFKDNRGLILSGDFSLPIVRDSWINYQLQNKNYLLSFDRQIENMEVQYGWQRAQAITGAVAGTLQGGATGAAAGGMTAGAAGAVVGGVIGTGTSLAGGIMDVNMQQALHNEALDFAKDNFGYQLGNIKALPNTLNKVSSIVANSKLFPFVEYYTCTDEERKAFEDKLKYNGMSIGRIGHILDFKHPDMQTYIKGQIIRLEGKFDTHMVNEIANEFNKGWYI